MVLSQWLHCIASPFKLQSFTRVALQRIVGVPDTVYPTRRVKILISECAQSGDVTCQSHARYVALARFTDDHEVSPSENIGGDTKQTPCCSPSQ